MRLALSVIAMYENCFWRQIRDDTFKSSQTSLFDGHASLRNK